MKPSEMIRGLPHHDCAIWTSRKALDCTCGILDIADEVAALEQRLDECMVASNGHAINEIVAVREKRELEQQVEGLEEAIREQQDTADKRECPCRLHFKHREALAEEEA